MKMKMRIKGRPVINSQITELATDKATRNRKIQAGAKESGNRKFAHIKKQTSMVASWFSPQKYKGFKSNFKK